MTTIPKRSFGTQAQVVAVWLTVLLFAAAPVAAQDQAFVEHVIHVADYNWPYLDVADLDGDGDIDILACTRWGSIRWYENGGGDPVTFTERSFAYESDVRAVFAADLDGDGDNDVLSASALIGSGDRLRWYENTGGSPPSFTRRTIPTTGYDFFAVYATDLDGDGDVDVITGNGPTGSASSQVAWYENVGGSPLSFDEHVISGSMYWTRGLFAADLDDDGDADILAKSVDDNKVVWYENTGGTPPGFTQRSIGTEDGVDIVAADMDGDGDLDVLAGSSWFESDGDSPPSFTAREIVQDAWITNSAFPADFTGNGAADLFTADNIREPQSCEWAWYESDGDLPPSFLRESVTAATCWAERVRGADFDDDGDIDTVGVESKHEAGARLLWFENQIVPGNRPPRFTSPECGSTIQIEPGETVEFTVTAQDADERVVTLDATGLPPDAVMNPTLRLSGNPVSSDFTWVTDAADDDTTHVMEFTATNDALEPRAATCTVTVHVKTIDLAEGLVAYYPFNGSADNVTGNGSDGTLVGGVFLTEDRFGVPQSAYEFDGSSGYINLGTALDVNEWDNFTISLWFLGLEQPNAGKVLDKTIWYHDFHFSLYGDQDGPPYTGRVEVGLYEGGWFGMAHDKNYRDRMWHHFVLVRQGPHGELWVDGALKASSDAMRDVHTNGQLLLGYSLSGDSNQRHHFHGRIDDARFYDRTLTESEIQQLFLPGRPMFTSPECGSTIRVEPGDTVEITVTAQDAEDRLVTLDASGLPPDAVMIPSLPITGNPVSSDFSWVTDTADDDTTHVIEFTATNDAPEPRTATCRVTIHVKSVMLRDGLVAWYPFDGNAADASGHGNDATVYGATLTADRRNTPNSAFAFDGRDDLIRTPRLSQLNTGETTVAAWVRLDTALGGLLQVIESNEAGHGELYIEISNARQLRFRVFGEDFVESSTSLDVGKWSHVTGVFSPAGGIKIYVDGTLEATRGSSSAHVIATDFAIGRDDETNFQHWPGAIDDVRIYDRALSEEEIARLFEWTGRPIFRSPECGGTHGVDPGELVDFEVRVEDHAARQITLEGIGLPVSALMTPPLPTTGNPVTSEFTWATEPSDAGTEHVVMFTATNDDPTGPASTSCEVTIRVWGPLDEGLLAWYPFDGNADDETGNGYDGEVHGASLTPNRHGFTARAYSFDGEDNYIDLGTDLDFPSTDPYALSLWFLNDGEGDHSNGYGQKILAKADWNSDFYLEVETQDGGFGGVHSITCDRCGGWPGTTHLLGRSWDYQDNRWHHVVLNRDGENGEMWVDGVLEDTSEYVQFPVNDKRLLIGYSDHGNIYQQRYWSGKIDDIRIYDRTVSPAEVQDLYLPGDRPLIMSPECGTRVTVGPGNGVMFTTEAKDRTGLNVTLDATGVPDGAVMNPRLPAFGNPVSSQFAWWPEGSDANTEHHVVLTATNDAADSAVATCEVTIEVVDYLWVTLLSFTATPGDGQVTLRWVTEAEIDNAGFYLLRTDVARGETVRANRGLIPAMGDVFMGAEYTYVDDTVFNGVTYDYVLVDVDLFGNETRHPAVRVVLESTDPERKLRNPVLKRPARTRPLRR